MAFRFRRSVKIAPGVRLNFGKKGGSLSIGGRGASLNFGSRGVYSNVGLPGSGLSYRSKIAGINPSPPQKTPHFRAHGSYVVRTEATLTLEQDGSVTFKDQNGNLLSDDLILQGKRQNREFITNWLEGECHSRNQEVESLINIHLTTPSPDTEITFVPATFAEQQPIPPSADFAQLKPTAPMLEEYGFLAKRIGFFRKSVDKRNKQLQEAYELELEIWESQRVSFETDYPNRFNRYQADLERYNEAKREFDENQAARKKFVEQERLNEPKAMQEFLVEVFQTIVWPRETNVSFDITDNGTCVLLDVDLPEIEDMPSQQTIVSKKDLRLIYKDFSEMQLRKNYFTHVHAIGFRLIGEVFVSLPSVQTVVFSGYSQRLDKRTGKIIDEYLYSVKVSRDKWNNLNFTNLGAIDVVSCFEGFELRRKATKTGVMTPIEPFR